jgi:hypothetical protein
MTTPSTFRPDRRTFLVASTVGFAGMQFGRPAVAAATEAVAATRGRAKSTILFFLCGGSSHIDMWDLKPDAPVEIRGEYSPIATSAPGVAISEHMPLTAKQALTGHAADPSFVTLGNNRTPMTDDWPYMGTVVGSRVPSRGGLPGAVTLPYMPSRLPYTRPGQFAARLGIEHDPLYIMSSNEKPLHFEAPALTLSGDVTAARLASRDGLRAAMNEARRRVDAVADVQKWSGLQERAMTLLGSAETTAAFNVADEPETVRAKYGSSVNAMSLLVARRLVEAGVPFITVFWMGNDKTGAKCASGGGWDTHSNNFNCLKQDLLPIFDRGYAALLGDLEERGLLDSTLVVVTSEMGRTPKVGGTRTVGKPNPGRDHWTHCQSVVLAGGGIRGGQVYGSSDKEAGYPKDKPVTPAHIAHTVYRQMGVTNLEAKDPDGRIFNLLAEGEPLTALT